MKFYERLTNVCHSILLDKPKIIEYLYNRGIKRETVQKYRIGAFPSDLRLLYEKYNMDAKELREHNIIWNANKSQFQLFPVVIPIHDIKGNTVALGCRTMLGEKERKDKGIPKYRNSSYKKTAHLFGMNDAYNSIRVKDSAMVVEGYFDAIMAYQHGINNVVATCGTLFHPRQLALLSRYTKNVCLLFDNDCAGKMSSRKVIDRLKFFPGVNITCSFTPDGFKDLDEYLRNGGDIDQIQ